MYQFTPPPLTPPTRGGGKTFPPPVPLTEGEKGGEGEGDLGMNNYV